MKVSLQAKRKASKQRFHKKKQSKHSITKINLSQENNKYNLSKENNKHNLFQENNNYNLPEENNNHNL